jgi:hypothetical protein
MNGPFVVAQATGGAARSGSSPVQIIKIVKPPAGQTEVFHASFNGTVKIDFTAIANQKITLYHDNTNQSLHIIFADGSQAIIEPFFDSMGSILANLLIEVGPGQDLSGAQFAAQFPITEDQSVLPAAGEGGNVASGADFHNPTVDLLFGPPQLPLLPPEELPNFALTGPIGPNSPQAFIDLIPTVSGKFFGVVEEEQLTPQIIREPNAAGQGNEDNNDVSGNDADNLPVDNTTNAISGSFASLVSGGDPPITFLANNAADGTVVKDADGNDVKSIGEVVKYVFVSDTEIQGWAFDGDFQDRLVFTLNINPDGTFTFTLNDQIDHPIHSHDDGTNPQGALEETLDLDISTAVAAHDATPSPVSFPPGTIEIGVIDDTPVAYDTIPGSFDGEEFFPANPLDDEDQANGIDFGPGDDGIGNLVSGTLNILPGADDYGSVSFAASISVTATDGVHTTSPSDTLQAIWVDGNGFGHKEDVTLTWTPDGSGGGTLTGSSVHIANVFTLQVDKFGDYTFALNAPLAHSFTDDPTVSGTQTEFEDNLQLQFTYTATDLDGDSVDAHLTINVDDDVPTLSLATDEGSGTTIVVHDETPGLQLGDELGFVDLPLAIQTVFNGLSNKGNDPDVGDDHGAIGYAVGGNGLAFVTAHFGADGAALTDAIHFALTLPGGNGVDSGLKTTEGDTIYLYQQTINGFDVIVGRIDADNDLAEDSQPGHFDHFDLHDPDDAVAFAITIDPDTGKVYLAQYLSLRHGSADAGDISEPVSLGSGTLTLSVTVTDGDGDAVTQAVDVSGEIQFLDDGPFVCVDVDRHFKVVLDEQPGVQSSDDDTNSSSVRHLFDSVSHTGSDPDVSPKDHGAINFAVSDHAALDVHAFFGADGPKDDNHNGHADADAIVYSLTLNGENGKVDSGLTTTDGKHILLIQEGDLIVGRVDADNNGSVDGNDTAAFAVAITDDGHVATALWLSLHHDDPNHTDDHDIVQLASGTVSATVTITDGDHDTASASADISGLIQFEDDGPSAKSNDTVVVEDDDLANGIDGGLGDAVAPQNASGILGHDYGSDGPGSIALLGANLPNGTFSVHLNDGTTLIIQQLQDGNNVDVLKIEITNATTGAYQVTQLHAIDHPTLDGHSGDNTENNLDFTVNYRITDGDGDHADGSIKIDVDDDSPDPRVTLASGTLVHDETPGVDGGSNDVAPSTALDALFAGVTNKGNDPDVTDLSGEDAVIGYAQQNASALVTVDPRYGADGLGSVVYGFDLNGSHPGTGLQTTDGRNISLFQVNDHLVVGRYEVGGNNNPDGSSDEPAAFAINIDPTSGLITVVQYVSIKHDDRGDPDESNDNGSNGNDAPPDDSPDPAQQWITDNALKLTVTVTDHDGDSFTTSANIGHKIIFLDDGIGAADTSPTFVSDNETLALVLDDEAQPFGITTPTAPEDVDNPEAAKVATGTLPITVGSDGLLSIAVDTHVSTVNSANGTSNAVSVIYLDPSNGNKATVETVTFTWTPDGSGGGDLVGTSAHYDSSNPAIVLHVNADGTYVLTLNAPLAHPFTDPDFQNNGPELGYEDNLTLQFTYVATDGDGDTASATLSVTVNDDKPVDFTPQDALLDDAAGSGTFALDVFGHTGADGLGTVVFTGIANGDRATATPQGTGDPITSNGHPIYLYNFGSILIGTTQVIADPSTVHTISDLASGQFVFEITLHPDAANSGTDTYTVQVFAPIDNGAGITFDNFSEIGSPGHTDYLVADLPGTQDLIVQGTTVGDSVNTATSGSSVDIGVNNQWIGSGEGIILDFVTLTNPTTSPPTYSNHNTINEATFTIAQVKGNAGDTSDVFVRAFTADNDSSFAPRNTDSGDTVTTITHVFVNGVDVTGSATAYNPDGLGNGFVLQDLHAGDVVVVETASGFNRLQISDAVGIGSQTYDGHDFSVTALGVGTVSAGSPVELSYQVLMTDGDGDGVTGTIQVGLEPVVPPLTQSGTFTGTVEEEQLGHTASGTLFASTFTGNEDTDTNGAPVDNDLDTANTGPNSLITTNIALGQDVVTGGTAPLDFHFASGIEGNQAQFAGGLGGVTSQGMPVYLHVDGGNPHLLIGYADGSGGTAHHYDAGTDRVVFTFEITDSAHGDATFTLYDNIDHSVGGQLGDNVEGTLTLDLNGIVEVSDSSSPQKSLLLDGQVNIIDDVPVAHDDAQTTTEGSAPTMNAILVLDFSLSMGDVVPNTGGKTRLQLMKEAVHDFLTNPDVTFNQVTVYTFGVGASLLGQFSDPAAADAAISALTTLSAGTNYAAATSLVDSPTGDGYANLSHPAADITNLYFLSDGDPTSGTSLTSAQETAWTNFLNDSGNDPDYPPIDKVYAIGFSDISSTTFLDQIAPRAGDVAEIVSDPTALSATLTSTLPPPETTGNVLTDGVHDAFGADGPHTVGGHFDGIVSITVDGRTYSFDGTSITLPTGNPAGATANGATLDVDTTLGGHLTFHFADGTGFSAGDYAYTAPASVSGDQVESFHYVIEDGDGDRTGADLQVTVHDNPNTPPTLALHGGDFVLDQFNSQAYNLNNGSVNWAGNWTEVGDDGSASVGKFLISTSGNSHLQISKSVGNGDYIQRPVDLSGAATAVLTFDYNTQNLGSGGRALHVQAWDGGSWQELGTISGSGTFSHVLTSAETILNGGIRFLVQGNWDLSGNNDDASASIDNVEISYTLAVPIADYITTYVENGAGVSIVDVTSAINDADSANMQAAHIVLTNEQAGDFLAINGTHVHNGDTGFVNGIAYTVSDNGSQIAIDLSGLHTKADYQAAINAITFASDSENPSEVDRIITATVTDDHGNVSNMATTTVHVDAVNDSPVATDDNIIINQAAHDNSVVVLPKLLMLLNDTDLDQDSLDITGTSALNDLASAVVGATSITVTNNSNSGSSDNTTWGQFNYTVSDGTATDTGHVTIGIDTTGAIDGTNNANVLYNTLSSGVTLNGGGGNDVLFGNSGNDILNGGSGRDIMRGGGGSDTYVFDDNDSGNTLATADIISDFDPANDTIDLSAVDAGPGGGDQNFGSFTQTSSVVAHGVSWYQHGADTVVQMDTDGNTATVEMLMVLTGVNANNVQASNFTG